ncbi:MAG TPA: nuclear transport factor 2 family protein [Moraxellaceae bacterium]
MLTRADIVAFVDAFNVDDLEAVMAFFADDAEYITFDGRHCRGKAAIREEFSAQFAGRYGRLRFLRDKLIVDAEAGLAAVSWRCEHGLEGSGPHPLLRRGLALLTGRKPYWEGVDLFRFRQGRLTGKYTYARTRLPLFHRAG